MSWPISECLNGQIMEHRPQPDDPDFEVAIGPCPKWPGCGCEVDLPEQRDGLDRLEDAMIEDVLTASDEDIIVESEEDGIDPEAVAAEWRNWLDSIIAKRFG